jgi:transposase
LQDAVLCYRNAYRVERIFNRLKSRSHIAPWFVKLHEQIEGLTSLLTLGVRVFTVTEFVLRRSLETAQTRRPGLHPEHKQKMTDKPTAERILRAFSDISLTIIKKAAGADLLRRLTPLSGVQENILQRLGLDAALYRQLGIPGMGT